MIGYRFPTSGAVCLAMAPSRTAGEHIVLMHLAGHTGQWIVGHLATHHFPAPEEWYWGHYFGEGNLKQAVKCFIDMASLEAHAADVVRETVEAARRRIDAVVMQGVGC